MYNQPSEQRDQMIFGIHAIREALKAGDPIDFIYVKRETNSDTMKELLDAIGERRVPVRRVPVEKLDRLTNRNHQGIIAVKAAAHYFTLEDVIPTLFEAGRDPFIVVLDGITDVRNFGAIARTCECAGVDAIVIFEQNSVSVTSDAVKTSAGALSRIAVCREKSVESVIDFLKESGIKVIGASEKATGQMYDVQMKGALALVMGAEDTGLSEYSLSNCDDLVRIPLFGEIGSLNVSVATGILLYEAVRQKK
ncbi:putative TrmH family tRNA/rRNA methyltransferase [Porphyromonas levii]|nr:23S rRNA (guanosine(2251)-2'-O)-methyltransferase RlmB [Porphyromonas levii]MBR8702890.1 putative TrmH family tRNA/rRNA methyltransferase [Porphyromonas levii]MBR8729220.1 putative TrmH family tRNA/rRNA methyltransferase [Porphyromonas levii]MBR8732311.1 putative TrmH family tRNA/rRNA methyltransferase [Porphyromonas levii]MBR8759362.1 putative TrmH family tRNA/rRNA methyltransferase [Porphyromonas levii]MBR8769491.1 putative TrmH family tRNA/rRNA methyltransferase [Porphyromonas levii]